MTPIANDEKQELLALIRKAKSSHIRWRAYAQGLVAGIDVGADRLPVRHTDCRFGHWYYGDGIKKFKDLAVFNDIEGPHQQLHEVYGQIHLMVGQGDISSARERFDALIVISRTLLKFMEELEAKVADLPER